MTTRVPGERRARRVTAADKIAATKAKREHTRLKHDRERALLNELMIQHGYMFHEMVRADDRYTMHFAGSPVTRKWRLTAARMLRVSMPEDSWLARDSDAALKKKVRDEARAKDRKIAKKNAALAKKNAALAKKRADLATRGE